MNSFLYSDSKMYLIKIIEISVNVVFIWKPKMITKRSIFLLTTYIAILKQNILSWIWLHIHNLYPMLRTNNSLSWCQQDLAHLPWLFNYRDNLRIIVNSIGHSINMSHYISWRNSRTNLWLFTILWTIKILCNAHLCIHNIVSGVSLSHENHHYTKLIARNL